MKKQLLFIIIVSALLFMGVSNFTAWRNFKDVPLNKLISDQEKIKKNISELKEQLSNLSSSSNEIAKKLADLAISNDLIEKEIFLKRYRFDSIALLLVILSGALLIVMTFRKLFKTKTKTRDSIIAELEIPEDMPKEIYVDDWEFQKRIENAFKTKREAIDWLKSDPTLRCDYCGARLRATITGKKEAIQLMTFYKKVPDGAKDLRVVLGSYWFAHPADELRCSNCERTIKR